MIDSGIGPMLREKIAAGEVSGCEKPPFLCRSQRTGEVFEVRAPEPPKQLRWEQLPVIVQARRYLEMGLLAREDYEAIARWHNRWHRRLARWLVHALQRFC